MTLEDWLAALSLDDLHNQLTELNDRKLHLLTAAFLRRVWDHLPSHHTRIAIEATEKFVDGRVTADQLTHLRSRDLLESAELLWASGPDRYDQLLGLACDCSCCSGFVDEYERRSMTCGKGFDGVRHGVDAPAWIAAQAALYARDLVVWAADPDERDATVSAEASAQYELFRDIAGPWVNLRWPEWRTETVRLIARGIHREQDFSALPILADALQDAGCDDVSVLSHCREASEHVRGCWVVDLAMGKA